MKEAVVFLHGLYMIGVEMTPLRRRVARRGFECHTFRYHSLLRTPRENAERLQEKLQTIDADVVHLVAHSLGGLVLLHLFDQYPLQKPGRVVMLGTPLLGSHVAANLYRFALTRPLMGRSCELGLTGGAPRWKGTRELGVIAGSKPVGLGLLIALGKLPRPNDGTVAVAETQAPEANLHLVVPYSHLTMIWSERVTAAVCQFLRTGRFID